MKLNLIALLSFVMLTFPTSIHAKKPSPLRIGSKVFSEALILGEILALIFEKKYNQPVTRRLNLGGTKVVFDALKNDEIDIYPEYTGTGHVFILKNKNFVRDPKVIYDQVKDAYKKRFNIIWGPQLDLIIPMLSRYVITIQTLKALIISVSFQKTCVGFASLPPMSYGKNRWI